MFLNGKGSLEQGLTLGTVLLQKKSNLTISLEGSQIPQAESIKYFGLHLDGRLNWKHHVKQKAEQIRIKTR